MLCLKLFECLLDFIDVVSQNGRIGNIVSATRHPAEFILFVLIWYSSVIVGLGHFGALPLDCLCNVDVTWFDSSELTFTIDFDVGNHVLRRHVVLPVVILPWCILPFLSLVLSGLIVDNSPELRISFMTH